MVSPSSRRDLDARSTTTRQFTKGFYSPAMRTWEQDQSTSTCFENRGLWIRLIYGGSATGQQKLSECGQQPPVYCVSAVSSRQRVAAVYCLSAVSESCCGRSGVLSSNGWEDEGALFNSILCEKNVNIKSCCGRGGAGFCCYQLTFLFFLLVSI